MPKKILLIDDDQDVRDLLTDLLVSSGYQVSAFAQVEDVLIEIKANRPDLILVDSCFRESMVASYVPKSRRIRKQMLSLCCFYQRIPG